MTTAPEPISLRLVLFFLLLHIINQIDRQLIAAFAGDIMHDLDLSRSQFALIAGLAFSGAYAFMSVAAGLLADRVGRVRVLTSGVAVWSVFTAAAGMAQGFWSMLAARPLVAAGEATLVPTATNIILARTADRHKAAAIGLFFAGIPLGIGGSFLIAGLLGPALGWRGCFLIMGLIGVLATIAVSRVRDATSGGAETHSIPQQLSQWWLVFRTNARLRWASLAMVFLHAHVATSPFVQLWLHEDKGLTRSDANNLYGAMFVVFGLAGSVGSGVLADWAQRRFALDRALSVLLILIALIPFMLAYRLMPAGTPLFLAGMAASVLFMTMLYGPVFTVIEAELPPHLKATATGINILALNILMIGGLAMAIGLSSDWLARTGHAQIWTMPLIGADLIAFLSLGFLWAAYRQRGTRRPMP